MMIIMVNREGEMLKGSSWAAETKMVVDYRYENKGFGIATLTPD